MSPEPESARSEIAYGVTRGLLLGVLAGAVEALFLSGASRLWSGPQNFAAQTATATAACMVWYATVGGAWGLLVGSFARLVRRWIPAAERASRVELLVGGLVPLAFVAHATVDGWPHGLRWTLPCGLAIVVGVLVLAALVSARLRELLVPWLGPWTLCTLFFGVGWLLAVPLSGRDESTLSAVTLAAIAVVLATGRSVRLRFPRLRPLAAVPILAFGALALLAAGMLRETIAFEREPRRLHRPGPGQPNVLIVTLDTTRADHMPDWGYARNTTPVLSEFGASALRFEHAVSAADLTLPSHASLFTGFYPPAHEATPSTSAPRGRPLAPHFATLAEVLAENGFATYGVVANHGFLGASYGLSQGFDYYDDRMPVPMLAVPPPFSIRKRVIDFLMKRLPERCFDSTYRKADSIADEMLDVLDRAHEAGERWLLFANFMDAHAPYDPPEPFRSLFPGRIDGFGYREFQELSDAVNSGRAEVPAEIREHMISQYDGGIAYVDSQLGRVFARLKELGEWDQTLVVITSDHGEAFGEHGTMNHGVSAYEEQVHVPLWFKLPGRPTGGVVRSRVSLVDVFPSVLEALGFDPPRELHGRSFLRHVADPKRVLFAENAPTANVASLNRRFSRPERAAYYGARKLLLTADGRFEVYDLGRDPDELRPDDNRQSPAAIRMVTELDRYIRAIGFGRLLPEPELAAGAFLAPPPGYTR
ncbi:MAG: sulfatase [Planctomycetes bacterium]|nr:sulfatase [Planctomycetota bacterium]